MGNEDRPDPSRWSQCLQFLWAILKDGERYRRLLILIAVGALIALLFKGSVEGLAYALAQRLPAWARSTALTAGIGCGVGGSVGWPAVRRIRRMLFRFQARETLRRKGPPAEPVTQAADQHQDDTFGEAGEGKREHAGDGDPGADPGRS